MPLSWNEIRHRAIGFAKTWAGESSEKGEKQTFWEEFFQVSVDQCYRPQPFESDRQRAEFLFAFCE